MDTLIVRVRPGETRLALVDGKSRLKDFALYRTQAGAQGAERSEEHTSELQSHHDLVCRLMLEKKNQI